jgi:sugar phosphate isomerase/epimerase
MKAMAVSFSLAHFTAIECSPPELVRIAARAGYDFVSFRLLHVTEQEPKYPLGQDRRMLKETKAAMEGAGLKLLDIELVKLAEDIDVKQYVPALEAAAELGGRHVLAAGFTKDRHVLVERFAEVCELAKPYRLTVDLEFITWNGVGTFREAKAVVEAAGCDNGGILIDTLHFDRSRTSLDELNDVPQEWFHYVHLCDAPKEIPDTVEGLIRTARSERLYPGEGGIDLAAILNRLPKVPCSLEIPHSRRTRELGSAEHARRCLEHAKKYVELHVIKD